MKRHKLLTLAIWLLCVALALGGCGSPSAPAGTMKVKLAQAANSLAFASVYLANAAGYFKDAGVEVEQIVMAGSAPASAALLNGEVDAMGGDLGKVFSLADSDASKLVLVQFPNNAVTLDLVFSNAYMQKRGLTPQSTLAERLRAMKGGKLGTLDVGGAPHKLMSFLGQKVGLHPEKDFEVIATGTPPSTFAALKNGSIDGFMLSAPTSLQVETEKIGTVAIRFSDVPEFKDSPSLGIAVRTGFAKQNPAAVKGMVQAIGRAHTLLAEKPAEAAKLLESSFPNMQHELLAASVKALSPAFGNKGRLSDEALRKAAELLKAEGFLDKNVVLKEGVHWTNEYND